MKKETYICDICEKGCNSTTIITDKPRIIFVHLRSCTIDICEHCLKKIFAAVGFNYHLDPQLKDSVCRMIEPDDPESFIDK